MKNVILHPDKILVRINSEERRKLFEKDITRDDGSTIALITGLQANRDEEAASLQTVTVGDVVGVGSNVSWVKVGDRAILDYTVDISDNDVAYITSDTEKHVCINAISKYHDTDFFVPANQNRQYDQYVFRKGDLDIASMLIGVIRNGEIFPNFPYIFMAYREPKVEHIQHSSGIMYSEVEEAIAERPIIAVHDRSNLKVGDLAVVELDSLFDRDADGTIISVIYEHDVLATAKPKILLAV